MKKRSASQQATSASPASTAESELVITTRSISIIDICRTSDTEQDLNITIEGRTLRLLGFNYPRNGRLREFSLDVLNDFGAPLAPFDSLGNPLTVRPIEVDPNDGTWQFPQDLIDDQTCDDDDRKSILFVVWWTYENQTSVHILPEVIRVVIPPCNRIPVCE
jgi:hypothetical protein